MCQNSFSNSKIWSKVFDPSGMYSENIDDASCCPVAMPPPSAAVIYTSDALIHKNGRFVWVGGFRPLPPPKAAGPVRSVSINDSWCNFSGRMYCEIQRTRSGQKGQPARGSTVDCSSTNSSCTGKLVPGTIQILSIPFCLRICCPHFLMYYPPVATHPTPCAA